MDLIGTIIYGNVLGYTYLIEGSILGVMLGVVVDTIVGPSLVNVDGSIVGALVCVVVD